LRPAAAVAGAGIFPVCGLAHPVDRFDTPLAAGDLCQVCRTGAVFAQAGYGVDDLLGDQGASGVVAVATLPALPLIPRAPYPRQLRAFTLSATMDKYTAAYRPLGRSRDWVRAASGTYIA